MHARLTRAILTALDFPVLPSRRPWPPSRRVSTRLLLLLLSAAAAACGVLALNVPAAAAVDRGERGRAAKLVRAIASLEGEARALSAPSFGGVWVNRGRRYLDVNIAFTRRPGRKVKKLAKDFPRPKLLDPIEVDYSLKVLEDSQAELIADRESFRGGPSPFRGVPGGAWDLDIDLRSNTLVVVVEDPSPDAVAAIKTRYGYDVIVRDEGILVPDVLYPCASRFLCYDLRSGLETAGAASSVGPGGGGCSTAFSSHIGRTTKGTMGILSAAHCGKADVGAPRFHAAGHAAQYGYVNRETQYGAVDAEWHFVSRDPFRALVPDPRIFVDDSQPAGKVDDVGKYDELVVGYTKVCKSGITTGRTCGTVTSKYASPNYIPSSSNFVRASLCSEGGDSGAGVYLKIPGLIPRPGEADNYEAVGILSGSKEVGCPDPADSAVFGHIRFAEKELGVKVVRAAE
jgi:hypothetical protein